MSDARNLTQKENSDAPSGFHEPSVYQPNNKRTIEAHLNKVLYAAGLGHDRDSAGL